MQSFHVLGDLYNSLFVKQTSNPEIMVDYRIWNQIKAALPKDYRLPDQEILNHIGYTSKKR